MTNAVASRRNFLKGAAGVAGAAVAGSAIVAQQAHADEAASNADYEC